MKKIIYFASLLIATVSCADQNMICDGESYPLSFGASASCTVNDDTDNAGTKGTLLGFSASSTLQDLGVNQFMVSAWQGTTAFFNSSNLETANYSTSWTLESGTRYLWPANTALSFYAYANMPASTVATVANSSTGSTLSYLAVPNDAAEQKDILLGWYSGNGTIGKADITFSHPLTAVSFKLGDFEGVKTINSITLTGVYESGTAQFVEGTTTWTSRSGSTSNAVTEVLATPFAIASHTAGDQIGEPFILIPQNLSTQSIIVTVNITKDDDTSVDWHTTINTGNWQAGHSNTYILGNVNYTLSITQADDTELTDIALDFSTTTSSTFKISSYKLSGGGESDVNWTAQVVDEDDKPVDWITLTPNYGSGKTSIAVSVQAADVPMTWDGITTPVFSTGLEHHTALSAKTESGTESEPTDLSKGGETANCYIVSAPGYYKLPIRKGNENTSTISGIHHAKILWQDGINLISEAAVSGSYLKFKVDADYIFQGNAIVAVCDASDNVLWAWHIWVTDDAYASTSYITSGDYRYTFANLPLGWRDNFSATYNSISRNCRIKITQEGGSIQYIPLTQAGDYTIEGVAGAALYNWGNEIPNYASAPSDSWTSGKTIYDPSPAGYMVPAKTAYSGFTTTTSAETFTKGGNYWTADQYYAFNSSSATTSNWSSSATSLIQPISTDIKRIRMQLTHTEHYSIFTASSNADGKDAAKAPTFNSENNIIYFSGKNKDKTVTAKFSDIIIPTGVTGITIAVCADAKNLNESTVTTNIENSGSLTWSLNGTSTNETKELSISLSDLSKEYETFNLTFFYKTKEPGESPYWTINSIVITYSYD